MSLEMYQANILDHYKHPHNFGKIEGAKNHAHVANPLCGDELDFFVEFDDQNKIIDVKFSGQGCTISIASASMLTDKLKAMNRADVAELTNDQIIAMLGVPINPARLKCATLSLEAAQQAIGHH